MLEVTFITEFFFTQIAISLCSCEFLYHLLHRCMEGYQHTIIFSHMHQLHMLLQQKSWFACLTTNLTLFSCDCKNRFSSLHFKYQIVICTIGDLWCNRHLLMIRIYMKNLYKRPIFYGAGMISPASVLPLIEVELGHSLVFTAVATFDF